MQLSVKARHGNSKSANYHFDGLVASLNIRSDDARAIHGKSKRRVSNYEQYTFTKQLVFLVVQLPATTAPPPGPYPSTCTCARPRCLGLINNTCRPAACGPVQKTANVREPDVHHPTTPYLAHTLSHQDFDFCKGTLLYAAPRVVLIKQSRVIWCTK